jgi:hypothetical protein
LIPPPEYDKAVEALFILLGFVALLAFAVWKARRDNRRAINDGETEERN